MKKDGGGLKGLEGSGQKILGEGIMVESNVFNHNNIGVRTRLGKS